MAPAELFQVPPFGGVRSELHILVSPLGAG